MHLQEQFRPRTFEELKGLQNKSNGVETDKQVLERLAYSGASRSLMFIGPPGTGKTSAALLFAKTYFGISYDEISEYPYIHIVNASGERGIDVIRGDVQAFMEMKTNTDKARIVIFDEADGLTYQAQEALKAIVEKYAHLTIPIFCLNKLKRMDDALISRSKCFYFNPVPKGEIIEWLIKKTSEVGLVATRETLETVADYYKGDLRRTVSDFIVPNQSVTCTQWNPTPTYADEIFNAENPSEKYLELSKEYYIEPVELIRHLLILNKYVNVSKFGDALLMLEKDPMIGILYAITGIKH